MDEKLSKLAWNMRYQILANAMSSPTSPNNNSGSGINTPAVDPWGSKTGSIGGTTTARGSGFFGTTKSVGSNLQFSTLALDNGGGAESKEAEGPVEEKKNKVKRSWLGWKHEKERGGEEESGKQKSAKRPTKLFAPAYNAIGAGLSLCKCLR
jgi:hypothetical protein